MSMIKDIGDLDIYNVRLLMNQMGSLENILEEDEYQVSKGLDTVYLDYRNLVGIDGVWLASDADHSGTNYGTAGTFNPLKGTITLTTPLPALNTPVLVTYSRSVGLIDDQITLNLNISKQQIMLELMDFELSFSESTNLGKSALYLAYFLTHLHSVHAMNTGNAVQGGFSYMMNQMQYNSKLWGEGMSAEALLNFYLARCKKLMDYLKLNSGPVATFASVSYTNPQHYKNDALLNQVSASSTFDRFVKYIFIDYEEEV